MVFQAQHFPKRGGEAHILEAYAFLEQWGHLARRIAGVAATDDRHKEAHSGMVGGEIAEALYGAAEIVNAGGCRNGVTMPLQALALPENGTEVPHSLGCGTAVVLPVGIAAEHENIILG